MIGLAEHELHKRAIFKKLELRKRPMLQNMVSMKGTYFNKRRICGKAIGLGLFSSNSLESQSYEIFEIADIGTYYGVE